MMNRHWAKFKNGVEIDSGTYDVSWEAVRSSRDQELVRTDPWALKDRTMSQEKKNYRIFLRDLPGNHDSANDAADAWAAYEVPE